MLGELFLTVFLVLQTTALDLPQQEVVDDLYYEITFYNRFFYERYLDTEREVCEQTNLTMEHLQSNFPAKLAAPLSALTRQTETVKMLVKDTEAEKCVLGVLKFLDADINTDIGSFKQCMHVPQTKQIDLFSILQKDTNEYFDNKDKTLQDLQMCSSLLPFYNQKHQRTLCIQALRQQYFGKYVLKAEEHHFESPCMTNFQLVLECISSTVTSLEEKIRVQMDRLYNCTNSLEDPISTIVMSQRAPFLFNSTINEQAEEAHKKYLKVNQKFEGICNNSYEQNKTAKARIEEINKNNTESFYKRLDEVFTLYFDKLKVFNNNDDLGYHHCKSKASHNIDHFNSTIHNDFEDKLREDYFQELYKMDELYDKIMTISENDLPLIRPSAVLVYFLTDNIFMENALAADYNFLLKALGFSSHGLLQETEDILKGLNSSLVEYERRTSTLVENCIETAKTATDYYVFELRECMFQESVVKMTFNETSPGTRFTVWPTTVVTIEKPIPGLSGIDIPSGRPVTIAEHITEHTFKKFTEPYNRPSVNDLWEYVFDIDNSSILK